MRAEPGPAVTVPRWLPLTGVLLSLAGLGVTIYLLVEHYTAPTILACPDNGVVNCTRVTSSAQSKLLGVPIVWPGLLFFAAMLVANLPAVWRSPNPAVRRGRLALGLGGVGFVLYLIYVELFVVDAICLWCTAVHVIAIALFGLAAVGSAFVETAAAPTRARVR